MTWVKIDDGVGTHRKHLAAGPVACWLWVAGLAWANQHATDGAIPAHALPALYPSGALSKIELRRSAAKLVEVGLWEARADGWFIHDYAQYQGEALRSARDERRKWEADRKAKQRAAKKNLGAERDSADLGSLSHRDMGGTGVGHVPGTNRGTSGGTTPGTGAPGVSQPPGPTRPVQIGNTHTAREGGPPRLGTVELFGVTADEVLVALRAGCKDRLNLAYDSFVLADLNGLVRELSTRAVDPVVGLAPYQTFAAWVGAGGLAWYDAGTPGFGYLLKPGVLAQHLGDSAAWEAAGRPAIKPRKAARADDPRKSYVGPVPPAPRDAFEHATLAQKLGKRWRAPTDGRDRDAEFLAQTGMTVAEARARVAALSPAPTGT